MAFCVKRTEGPNLNKCFRCQHLIQEDQLMIGSSTPLIPWLWFHIPCFKAPLLLNKVEEIAGFSEIDREEQNRIQKMIEDQIQSRLGLSMNNGSSKSQRKVKSSQQRKKQAETKGKGKKKQSDSESDFESDENRSDFENENENENENEDELIESDQNLNKRKSTRLLGKETKTVESLENFDDDDFVSNSKPNKKTKIIEPKLVEEEEQLQKNSVKILKRMLSENDQITSGTKGELIERIIQCMRNGGTPICPKCNKGHLQVEVIKENKIYKCPGYFESRKFKKCGFIGESNSIILLPWKELTGKDAEEVAYERSNFKEKKTPKEKKRK